MDVLPYTHIELAGIRRGVERVRSADDHRRGCRLFDDGQCCTCGLLDDARWLATLAQREDLLRGLLAEPYGCSFCDSGKLRNPTKGHLSDCPYERAAVALADPERTRATGGGDK
jgi:hypothetical protein